MPGVVLDCVRMQGTVTKAPAIKKKFMGSISREGSLTQCNIGQRISRKVKRTVLVGSQKRRLSKRGKWWLLNRVCRCHELVKPGTPFPSPLVRLEISGILGIRYHARNAVFRALSDARAVPGRGKGRAAGTKNRGASAMAVHATAHNISSCLTCWHRGNDGYSDGQVFKIVGSSLRWHGPRLADAEDDDTRHAREARWIAQKAMHGFRASELSSSQTDSNTPFTRESEMEEQVKRQQDELHAAFKQIETLSNPAFAQELRALRTRSERETRGNGGKKDVRTLPRYGTTRD